MSTVRFYKHFSESTAGSTPSNPGDLTSRPGVILRTMKAIVLHEVGPAENLHTELEWPDPVARKGQIVVRVHAVGVCYRDIIDRRGGFPFMKRPLIPGHELAGEIVTIGEGVDGLTVGDRVVSMHRGACGECEYCQAGHEPRCVRAPFVVGLTIDGGYAEKVALPAKCVVPLPEEVSYQQGCFLFCTAGVALRALRTHGRLESGQTALVTGASGGLGLHAMQVARALGAEIVAITSSERKAEFLRQSGADHVVVATPGSRNPDALAFHKEVKRLTGGVHVVLDCVGDITLNSSIRSLRPMGRCVVAGNITTGRYELNPGLAILNELTLCGTSGCTRRDLEQVLAWTGDGTIEPVIADVLGLDQAVEAQKRLEARAVTGRIVLMP